MQKTNKRKQALKIACLGLAILMLSGLYFSVRGAEAEDNSSLSVPQSDLVSSVLSEDTTGSDISSAAGPSSAVISEEGNMQASSVVTDQAPVPPPPAATGEGDVAFADGVTAPVEVTNVIFTPAALPTMPSYKGGLTIEGQYKINDLNGAAGAVMTLTLNPASAERTAASGDTYFAGKKFFDQLPSTIITTDDMDKDAAAASIDPDTGAITVSIPFKGGAVDGTGNFSVVFPFDHATFDSFVGNGTTLGAVSVAIEKDGVSSGKEDVEILSSASNTFTFGGLMGCGPAMPVIGETVGTATVGWQINEITSLKLEPGTKLYLTMKYPVGTTIVDAAGGMVDAGSGLITWEYPVNATGQITGAYMMNGHQMNFHRSVKFMFPEDSGFEPGQKVGISNYYSATKWGEAEPAAPVVRNYTLTLVGKTLTGHMGNLEIGNLVNGNPSGPNDYPVRLDVDRPETASSWGATNTGRIIFRFNQGMVDSNNDGTLDSFGPLPNTVLTWYNDSGSNKARLTSLERGGTTVESMKLKGAFYICDAQGTHLKTETRYFTKLSVDDLYNAAAGEYIYKFEIWPLDNEESFAELAADPSKENCVFSPDIPRFGLYLDFKSWPGKVFPDGTPIKNQDVSKFSASLSWEGENNPELFPTDTNPDPDVVTLEYPERTNGYHSISYCKDALFAETYVEFQAGGGGSKVPGDVVPAELQLRMTSKINPWRDPIIYILPPETLSIDTSQELYVYSSKGVNLGAVAIEGPLKIGTYEEVYKLTLPEMTVVYSDNASVRDTIPIEFTVKDGAAPGVYQLARYNDPTTFPYPQKAGRIISSSARPYGLGVLPWQNAGLATNAFYMKDINDIDNNPDTQYQKVTSSAANITIIASNNLLPSAQLLNKGEDPNDPADDVWETLSDASEATVGLTETGQVKLQLTNRGNSFVGDIRMLNILPHVGDTMVLDTARARGSEWPANLESLDVKIYAPDGTLNGEKDGERDDMTGRFTYTLRYSTQQNPSYGTGGINRTGTDGVFAANTTDVTKARSFDFVLNERLPAGYTIEFLCTVQAPATAGINDIDKTAFNSFAVTGNYYTTATGGTATQAAGPFEPIKQKFILADGPIASLSIAGGRVFKDLNGNNVWDEGIDEPFVGVAAELYRADAEGKPTGNVVAATSTIADNPATAAVNEAGTFHFGELYSDSYVIKFTLPTSPADGGAYVFCEKGGAPSVVTDPANLPASAVSMVGEDGYSPVITIAPGMQAYANLNVGIQAQKELRVEFREDAASGTLLSSIPAEGMATSVYAADAPAYTGQTATIVPGSSAGYSLPAGYCIKTGTNAQKIASYTWDELTQTLVFVVTKTTHDVKFDLNGGDGTAPATQTLPWGSLVQQPTAPVREGYFFVEWNDAVDAEGAATGTTWSFATDTVPQNEVTLYAVWEKAYRLTFDAQGGTPRPDEQLLRHNQEIARPAQDPDKEGHDFTGWFDQAEGGVKWDFKDAEQSFIMPDNDVALFAQYLAISYEVTFDYGAAPIAAVKETFSYGTLVAKPQAPVWAGNKFITWLDENGNEWDFDNAKMPAGDIVLTAQWEAISFTVTFVDWDGRIIDKKPVAWNGSVTPPAAPTRQGYTFARWDGRYANVIQDETVTAVYSIVPPPPGSTPSSSIVSSSSGTSSSVPSSVPSTSESAPSSDVGPATSSSSGAGTGSAPAISDTSLPLGSLSSEDTWSLLNLVFSAIALLFSIYLLVSGFRRRGKEGSPKSRFTVLRIVSIAIGVLMAILFVLLENMSGTMAWVNRWTPLILAAFLLQAILNIVQYATGRNNRKYPDDEDGSYA